MSKILKFKNININLLIYLFILANLIIYIFSLMLIKQAFINYTIFSILSFLMLIYCNRPSSTFIDKFFSFYMWLGFWLNYSLNLIFFNQNYLMGIGAFDFSNLNQLNELFILCSISFVAIIIASFLSQKIKNLYFNYKNENFYLVNPNLEKHFWFYFIILILFLIFILYINNNFIKFNYYYFKETNYPKVFEYFLKWFFLFGFSCFVAYFINLYKQKKNKFKIFLLFSLIQDFLFYNSILIRGSIFNSLALIYATFLSSFKLKKNKIKLSIILLVASFVLMVVNVQDLRKLRAYGDKEKLSKNIISVNKSLENEKFSEKTYKVFLLIKDRIFGIDSAMAVVAFKNKNFNLLKDALNEKFDPGYKSFFDRLKSNQLSIKSNSNHLTLPGIIPFLYYSGSLFFVFFILIIIQSVLNIFLLYDYLLNKNLFLSALLGQFIAYRLWHFGYSPINSFKFLLSIILTSIFIYFFHKLLIKTKIVIKN